MYVPGKITKPELPLIDIGTGYYAENVRAIHKYLLRTSLAVCFMSRLWNRPRVTSNAK